jgi:hypothetical protein
MGAASRTAIGLGAVAAGAGGVAGVVNGRKKDSPPLSDSDSEGDSSSNEYEEAAEGSEDEEDAVVGDEERVRPRPGRRSSSASAAGKKRTGPMSKAAKIAQDKMEENVKTRNKLGKPLAQLTAQDVALTEADVKEDISVVWKAM